MNTYQSWNRETREKSRPVKHRSLAEAISRIETEIALAPSDNDDEGWRVEDLATGEEMTLAGARSLLL